MYLGYWLYLSDENSYIDIMLVTVSMGLTHRILETFKKHFYNAIRTEGHGWCVALTTQFNDTPNNTAVIKRSNYFQPTRWRTGSTTSERNVFLLEPVRNILRDAWFHQNKWCTRTAKYRDDKRDWTSSGKMSIWHVDQQRCVDQHGMRAQRAGIVTMATPRMAAAAKKQ